MPRKLPRAVALALVLSFTALPMSASSGAAEAPPQPMALHLEGAAPAGVVLVHVSEDDWRPRDDGSWAFSINYRIHGLPAGRLAYVSLDAGRDFGISSTAGWLGEAATHGGGITRSAAAPTALDVRLLVASEAPYANLTVLVAVGGAPEGDATPASWDATGEGTRISWFSYYVRADGTRVERIHDMTVERSAAASADHVLQLDHRLRLAYEHAVATPSYHWSSLEGRALANAGSWSLHARLDDGTREASGEMVHAYAFGDAWATLAGGASRVASADFEVTSAVRGSPAATSLTTGDAGYSYAFTIPLPPSSLGRSGNPAINTGGEHLLTLFTPEGCHRAWPLEATPVGEDCVDVA